MRILYATDGSEGALAGARFLAKLPLTEADELRVLAVVGSDEGMADETALAAAREALGDSAARITTAVREGNAAEQILDAADDEPTDLLVVGTKGRSAIARFFLGSVAERVAQYAPCPVLLARPLKDDLRKVLVGVDGSDSSTHAARWMRGFPLPPECKVRLVTVVVPPELVWQSQMMQFPSVGEQLRIAVEKDREVAEAQLRELAESLSADGRPVATEVIEGDPSLGILDAAAERSADLIVVGKQGLTGIDRFLLGGVTEKVLRHAPCSVLVVR